jgi:hypothetical protein
MNISNALQTGLIGLNRNLDNNLKAAGDQQGTGQVAVAEMASGREVDNALKQTTIDPAAQAATTKVVTDASEVLGTNIDVHA